MWGFFYCPFACVLLLFFCCCTFLYFSPINEDLYIAGECMCSFNNSSPFG